MYRTRITVTLHVVPPVCASLPVHVTRNNNTAGMDGWVPQEHLSPINKQCWRHGCRRSVVCERDKETLRFRVGVCSALDIIIISKGVCACQLQYMCEGVWTERQKTERKRERSWIPTNPVMPTTRNALCTLCLEGNSTVTLGAATAAAAAAAVITGRMPSTKNSNEDFETGMHITALCVPERTQAPRWVLSCDTLCVCVCVCALVCVCVEGVSKKDHGDGVSPVVMGSTRRRTCCCVSPGWMVAPYSADAFSHCVCVCVCVRVFVCMSLYIYIHICVCVCLCVYLVLCVIFCVSLSQSRHVTSEEHTAKLREQCLPVDHNKGSALPQWIQPQQQQQASGSLSSSNEEGLLSSEDGSVNLVLPMMSAVEDEVEEDEGTSSPCSPVSPVLKAPTSAPADPLSAPIVAPTGRLEKVSKPQKRPPLQFGTQDVSVIHKHAHTNTYSPLLVNALDRDHP